MSLDSLASPSHQKHDRNEGSTRSVPNAPALRCTALQRGAEGVISLVDFGVTLFYGCNDFGTLVPTIPLIHANGNCDADDPAEDARNIYGQENRNKDSHGTTQTSELHFGRAWGRRLLRHIQPDRELCWQGRQFRGANFCALSTCCSPEVPATPAPIVLPAAATPTVVLLAVERVAS